jgi:outer membrane beta-barrel protein
MRSKSATPLDQSTRRAEPSLACRMGPPMQATLSLATAFLFVTTAYASSALAQTPTGGKAALPPKTPSSSAGTPAVVDSTHDDKLDVSGLEKKYWAAKDTDFSVVQNRLFSKAGRVALSLGYGSLINDSWSSGASLSGDLNYYFSERYGIQAEYTQTNSRDNDAVNSLRTNQGGIPNHDLLKKYYGVGFNWVPFYAKVSVLNSSIIYFDMSVTPGLGISTYQEQLEEGGQNKTSPTLSLDVTQHYFLNKWFALRFDFKNRWYQQDVLYFHASSVPTGGSRKASTDLNYSSSLMFGLTFYY